MARPRRLVGWNLDAASPGLHTVNLAESPDGEEGGGGGFGR